MKLAKVTSVRMAADARGVGRCDHPCDGQCLSRTSKTGKTNYIQML